MNKRSVNQRNGAGRQPKRNQPEHKKNKLPAWIFLTVFTTLNLLLSIALRISDRKQMLHAVEQDERLSLLYSGEKTTKTQ